MKTTIFLFFAFLVAGCGSQTATNDTGPVDHSNMDHSTVDHSASDHGSMDHAKLESSPGAADAPLELQFIDSMIAHHDGAIEMAKLGTTRAGRPEMKKFMDAIIADQDRETTQMIRWRGDWHRDEKPAINMDFPGMREGMNGMDMEKLGSLSGNDFDSEFARQMIRHHEGAVMMSNYVLEATGGNAPRKELKQLAEAIVKAQTGEIEQMKKWLGEWK